MDIGFADRLASKGRHHFTTADAAASLVFLAGRATGTV
jgi:hypothetical protein